MKVKLVGLLLGLSTLAFAGNGSYYLGGALNLIHCSQLAGAGGYRLAAFGPGFDEYGRYYPFLNACFGMGKEDGGVPTGEAKDYWFYPYLSNKGYSMNTCIADLKEVKGLWECKPWLGNHSYIMECEAKRRMTLAEGKQVKDELASYKCVDLVDGPRDRRTTKYEMK